jgi:5-methylcytosine-specific restriction enzyme B
MNSIATSHERIESVEDKKAIIDRWHYLVEDETADLDSQIAQIRAGLTEIYGENFSFYGPLVRPAWDSNASQWDRFIYWAARVYKTNDFDEHEREWKLHIAERMRVAREAVRTGSDQWIADLRRAFAGRAPLADWRTYEPLLKWCEESPDEAARLLLALWDNKVDFRDRTRTFLESLPSHVASTASDTLAITSQLLIAESEFDYPFFRTRVFENGFKLSGYPRPRADISHADRYLHVIKFVDRVLEEASERGLELRDRLDTQSVLWRLRGDWYSGDWPYEERVAFAKFLGRKPPDPLDQPESVGQDGAISPGEHDDEIVEVPTIGDLAEDLFIDVRELEKIERLLEDKRQAIFYGPPGTGKTYIAMKLAEYLAGDRSRVSLVQFHPAYAYEDFVEGFRPRERESGPGFELVSGPLKEIAEQARADREHTYVLIIDEINRGNVARIFGELYFLLEYRNENIRLQYSAGDFSLPENLLFIGTMNTADRSIALIDAALRRRFYFVPFFPKGTLVEGVLHRWWERHDGQMKWVADLVDAANERLGDHHAGIGPSYFMRGDLTEDWARLIWEHQIIPYLEEHFFGEPDRLEEFRFDRLLVHLVRGSLAAGGDLEDGAEPHADESGDES